MTRGKEVFAESCAACHSSKQPPANIDPQSGEGKAWFRAAVMKPDFLEDNFLSNDKRYPLTKIETNSARAFGTNAKAGHVWDNFSSQTYKELSPVDELEFFNPFDETQPDQVSTERKKYRAGILSHGVTRQSSGVRRHFCTTMRSENLPAIHPSPDAWMRSMMRLRNCSGRRNGWATIPSGGRKTNARCICERNSCRRPCAVWRTSEGYINVGPIPKSTPVNLIANLEPDFGTARRLAGENYDDTGENSHHESFSRRSDAGIVEDSSGICLPPTSVPISSRTKATISEPICLITTNAR